MPTLPRVAVTSALAAASLALAPGVSAAAAVPGDNGDVKVHQSTTSEWDEANQPHVCAFYLDAFNFDAQQSVSWWIDQWAPTGKKATRADSGTITLGANGHGRTADQALPDGHYKLYWTFAGEHGAAKQKVFWVDCGAGGGPTGAPSTSASASASSPAGGPSGGPSGGASGSSSAPASSASASASSVSGVAAPSSASPSPSGSLAETGADVGGITLGALLLIGGGAVMVMRRRRPAGRH
jgi:LPXTG-motif cell wall-anchored protein